MENKLIIKFRISCADTNIHKEFWEILYNIECVFRMYCNDTIIFKEKYFNAVEFAAKLAKWLRDSENSNIDFIADTLAAEEPLFWLKFTDKDWLFGANYPENHGEFYFTKDALVEAAKKYIEDVVYELEYYFEFKEMRNFIEKQSHRFK